MFAFELWREYKLSIAEIYALFPEMEIIYFDEKILLVKNIKKDFLINISNTLWWTIKIIEIENWDEQNHPSLFILRSTTENGLYKRRKEQDSQSIWKWDGKKWISQELKIEKIFEHMQSYFQDKKNNFAINFYGKTKLNQQDLLLKAKKYFQKNNFSTRFINQDFQNIKSYQIIKEKLINSKTDFNLIFSDKETYIWNTIFVQDIDSYSKRDFWKQRDMQTGMLPPKLAQIMINLSQNWKNIEWQILKSSPFPLFPIYDPFCWLWTILLESILAWNKEIFGSDINSKMIEKTTKNIEFIKNNFENNLETYEIVKFDAKQIANSPILKNHHINSIVTEWYLWEIFWEKNISLEKIKKVRMQLKEIFEWFFSWLQNIKFSWIIIISFPFWEIKWKYYYFEEIYEILNKYCIVEELLPKEIKTTKTWSLLYKRSNQTVWREIFKLKIKNS